MPLSPAATVTAMAALPTQNVASGNAGAGLVVNVKLSYANVAFVPANLLTALLTQYGAGKVFSGEDAVGQNEFSFTIIP